MADIITVTKLDETTFEVQVNGGGTGQYDTLDKAKQAGARLFKRGVNLHTRVEWVTLPGGTLRARAKEKR